MGTTEYFNQYVVDAATKKELQLEVGKTNYAGEGPQMYLKLGDSYVILSHEDAKAFSEGVASVGRYMGYDE